MADSLFAMQPTPRLELRMYESNNTTSDGHKSCAKETCKGRHSDENAPGAQ